MVIAFIVFKTITVFFTFQRQLSPLACIDNHIFHSLSFLRLSESFVETSMSPLLCKTSRFFVDILDVSYAFCFLQVSLIGLLLVTGRMVRSLEQN